MRTGSRPMMALAALAVSALAASASVVAPVQPASAGEPSHRIRSRKGGGTFKQKMRKQIARNARRGRR